MAQKKKHCFLGAHFAKRLMCEILQHPECRRSILYQDSKHETHCMNIPPRSISLERTYEKRASITNYNLIKVAIPHGSLPSFYFTDIVKRNYCYHCAIIKCVELRYEKIFFEISFMNIYILFGGQT